MPRAAADLSKALQGHAHKLERFTIRMEALRGRGELTARDIERIYGGAFLAYYVRLEQTLEELFFGLVMGRLTVSSSAVRAKVTIRSERVAREVIIGDRRFIDWLPYAFTRARANAFLASGLPFASVTDAEEKSLERARHVRNALSHQSRQAMEQFKKHVIAGAPLPASQHRPDGFLRGQHAPGQTRFSFMLAESVAIVRRLCK